MQSPTTLDLHQDWADWCRDHSLPVPPLMQEQEQEQPSRSNPDQDLASLVGILTSSYPTDLCIDVYSELPIFTMSPSESHMPLPQETTKGVKRFGQRTVMSMVHLALHTTEWLCTLNNDLPSLERSASLACKILRATLLSRTPQLCSNYFCPCTDSLQDLIHDTNIVFDFASLNLKRSSSASYENSPAGYPPAILLAAIRANSLFVNRLVEVGSASASRLSTEYPETAHSLTRCLSLLMHYVSSGPTPTVANMADSVLAKAIMCLPESQRQCPFLPHKVIQGKTSIQTSEECLFSLLSWLGNSRTCCTSKGASDCIEDKFFSQVFWSFIGTCKAMMLMEEDEALLPFADYGSSIDDAMGESLLGSYGSVVDQDLFASCLLQQTDESVWRTRVQNFVSSMQEMRFPQGAMMSIFHLIGSFVQCMGTVSGSHSYRLLIAESYSIIVACTRMFSQASSGSGDAVVLHRFGLTKSVKSRFFSPFIWARDTIQCRRSVFDETWRDYCDLEDIQSAIVSRSLAAKVPLQAMIKPVVPRLFQPCQLDKIMSLLLFSNNTSYNGSSGSGSSGSSNGVVGYAKALLG